MHQLLFKHPEYAILFGVVIYFIIMYLIYLVWNAMQPKIVNNYVYKHNKEISEQECKNIIKYNDSVKSIFIMRIP
jgi:threonine/homoserine/homoserine lactone efflux protein